MSYTDSYPDLNQVMAAVGHHVFSFFPIGSLINGSSSPMLVNSVFRHGSFQCLGQMADLSLSQCPHLRGINDGQLIDLVKKVAEMKMSEASNLEYNGQNEEERQRAHDCSGVAARSFSMKMTHLDLSRCRFLTGEAVHFVLKHAPNVRRILLSSAARFDAAEAFVRRDPTLKLPGLEHVDLSGCRLMDAPALTHFLDGVGTGRIRHLDLSGASSLIDDDVFGALACLGDTLESLSLAGAKRITSSGVGLISYVCRDTLRCLNLRGCEGVNLAEVLLADAFDVLNLARVHAAENHRLMLPRNSVEGLEVLDTNFFVAVLSFSLSAMMTAHPRVLEEIVALRRRREDHRRLERRWSNLWGWSDRQEERIFGRLEQLDVGMVGNGSIRLEGCVAVIAWLNGGRLRHVDLSGLDGVLPSDLAVLSGVSRGRLLSLTTSSSQTISPPNDNSLRGYSLSGFFGAMKNMRELDLSFCNFWDGQECDDRMIATLTTLRSLKVDHTSIPGATVGAVLCNCKHLLRLSVRGCPNVKFADFQLGDRLLGVIDFDCQDVQHGFPLAKIRDACPFLLRLNNRCTTLGSRMLQRHRSNFLWRVGGASKYAGNNLKRKRQQRSGGCDGIGAASGASSENDAFDGVSALANRCSTLWTGFSQAKDTEQEMFGCKTCAIDGFGHFVCLMCANSCHKGHSVFSLGFGLGYCDCCIYTHCKCIDRGTLIEDQHNDFALDVQGLPPAFGLPFDPSAMNV